MSLCVRLCVHARGVGACAAACAGTRARAHRDGHVRLCGDSDSAPLNLTGTLPGNSESGECGESPRVTRRARTSRGRHPSLETSRADSAEQPARPLGPGPLTTAGRAGGGAPSAEGTLFDDGAQVGGRDDEDGARLPQLLHLPATPPPAVTVTRAAPAQGTGRPRRCRRRRRAHSRPVFQL